MRGVTKLKTKWRNVLEELVILVNDFYKKLVAVICRYPW